MTTPNITEQAIRKHCGEQNFERSQRYHKNGSIYDTRREGDHIKASCRGSQDNSYRLQVDLKGKNIVSGRCSCPVGASGHCKHIAAMLLTWISESESFIEMPALAQSLKQYSNDKLIELIQYLLQIEPDLESIVAARILAESDPQVLADPAYYQKQADTIFDLAIRRKRSEMDVSDELEVIGARANKLIAEKDYKLAVVSYLGLIRSVLHNLVEHQYYDDEGYISAVIVDSVGGLAQCLRYDGGVPRRHEAIDLLMEVYVQDMGTLGGVGLSDEIPGLILELANTKEKQIISVKIHEIMQDSKVKHDDWLRAEYQKFIDAIWDS